jgi:hypothetical protein
MDVPQHERALFVPTGYDPEVDEATDELRGGAAPLGHSASVIAVAFMSAW